MADATELVRALKTAALDAQESARPVQLCFGKVTGEKPLRIQVEQKLALGEKQLIVPERLTDYEADITASFETEKAGAHGHSVSVDGKAGEAAGAGEHAHAVKLKRKTFTVHAALKEGDTVLLARMQGGQRFVVMDRVRS